MKLYILSVLFLFSLPYEIPAITAHKSFPLIDPVPEISSATYNASTGELLVTGINFAGLDGPFNDIDATKIKITGSGGGTFIPDEIYSVEIIDEVSFKIVFTGSDFTQVNSLLNRNGFTAWDSSPYHIDFAVGWNPGAISGSPEDSGTPIWVSGVVSPTLTSATYDSESGILTLTGTNFQAISGDDINVILITLGDGTLYYPLSPATPNVEINSSTAANITVAPSDRVKLNSILNSNGNLSATGGSYKIQLSSGWNGFSEPELIGKQLSVVNYTLPAINSVSYNATTDEITFTGNNFASFLNTSSDINPATISIFGGNNQNYTLTGTYIIKISNPNSFIISLNGADITNVNSLFNRNLSTSFQGTNYSVQLANGWNSPVSWGDIAATVTNVTVSGVLSPEVESAIYDFSTGNLNITGKNLVEFGGNDIDVTRITLSNGVNSYTLTSATANVNINNSTSAIISISGIDRAGVGYVFDKDGFTSINTGVYNIAVVSGWNGLGESDVNGNPVQVNNFAVSSISSVAYNATTGTFNVTGNNFVSNALANDDIDPTKFIISAGIYSYTISSSTPKVDVTNNTSFSFVLAAADRTSVNNILNWNGTKSREDAVYNLAAYDDWNSAANVSLSLAAPVNGITVSGVPNYAPLASNVSLTGNTINSSVLTFSYTYLDYENDLQGSSTIKWYTSTDNIGTNKTLIAGNSGLTYTLQTQDTGKYIFAEVTPIALTGTLTGITVASNYIGLVENAVPVTSSVAVSGSFYLNQTITGTYIYSDLENDPQGASTYQWYRADVPTGPDLPIAGANQKTYTITTADLGKYLTFEIVPVSTSTAHHTGVGVKSSRYQVLNAAPVATLLSISGTKRVGQILLGDYTYTDLENDPQGTSAYIWYRANAADGSGKVQIAFNTKTYVVQQSDMGKFFSFEVVPAASSGTITGLPIATEFFGPVENSVPVVTNISIMGTQAVCKTLHGDYDYSDIDGDPEGASVYQWYTSTTVNGTKTAIAGANERDYTLTINDQGKYIYFEVKPRAISGNTTGVATYSNVMGTIINLLPTVTFSGSASICYGSSTKLTLNFTGTPPWNLTYTDGTNQHQIVSSVSVYMLSVSDSGTYKGVVLTDNINCPVTNLNSSTTVDILSLPDVEISNLNSAYNLRGNPVPLTGNPTGGTFSGLGVISATNMFYPSIAGTLNSPHTIIYEYSDPQNGCTNRDTAIVEVIDADASITGLRASAKYCNFDDPFTITGTNYVGGLGTFAISGGVGLTDNRNNTATLNPGLLNAGTYTISYTYIDGIPLTIYKEIVIDILDRANIFGLTKSQYCHNNTPIEISGNYSGGVFSGNSVYKNTMTNKFYFTPSQVNPGSTNILYSYTTSYGCVLTKSVDKIVLSVPVADFSVKDICYKGDSTSFRNLSTYSVPISSWAWRFGDVQSLEIENMSALFEPKHKYPSTGNRIIQLIAENTFGCHDTVEKNIYLGDIPKANFTWGTECLEKGVPISFKSTSTSVDQLVTYHWNIEDTSSINFSYNGKEILHTFPVLRNYHVKLKISSEYNCSDSVSHVVSLRPIYTLKDSLYFNNFEKGMGYWHNSDSVYANNWYFGTPSGSKIRGAYSGTKAFYTSLKDTRKNQQLVISSPCFDFRETNRPFISMRTFSNATLDQEGTVLQYTRDAGINWENVGSYKKGNNWFNSYSILSQPGGQQIGWSGTDLDYANSSYSLDFLANEPRVQFRMVFGESSKASGTEGFAFDDISISSRNKNVLIEHFTNNSQQASLDANKIVDNLVDQQLNDAISMQYHTSFPGVDTFNIHNSSDPGARVLYYGIGYPPLSLLQGGTQPEYICNYITKVPVANDVDVLSLTPALFKLQLKSSFYNNKISGSVDIRALGDLTDRIVSLHIVVVEDIISQINGTEVTYKNVVKKMLPSPGGTPFNRAWAKDNIETVNFSWDYKNVYNPQNTQLIAFLQDETSHEVYQVGIDTANLKIDVNIIPIMADQWKALVFPNPASDWLNIEFPETKNGDFKLQIVSLSGKLVWEDNIQKGVARYEMTTESLKNGVYFIRILNKLNVVSMNKLVIVH